MPTVELPPETPFTLHVKLVGPPSVPVIVAVKTCAPLIGTIAVVGATVTTMWGGGGGDVAPVVPAHEDSKSAHKHSTATLKAAVKLPRRRSPNLVARMHWGNARNVPQRSRHLRA